MSNLEKLASELAQMHEWLFQSIPDKPVAAGFFQQIVEGYEATVPVNDIPKLRTLLTVKLRHQSP